MQRDKIVQITEALIFSSQTPVNEKDIVKVFDEELKEDEVKVIIQQLNETYEKNNRSFRIDRVASGYVHHTLPEYYEWLIKKDELEEKPKLTYKGLETLSIVAYKQPITRTEIEAIRGVNSDYLIRQLLEKDLITIKGRAQAPGQPLLYGTSDRFLRYFGLNELEDLPKLREIDELLQSDDRFLKKLNQHDIQELDPEKLGLEFVEKIKSVLLKDNPEDQDQQNQ